MVFIAKYSSILICASSKLVFGEAYFNELLVGEDILFCPEFLYTLIPLPWLHIPQNPSIPMWSCFCTMILMYHHCHTPFQKYIPRQISLIDLTSWDVYLCFYFTFSELKAVCVVKTFFCSGVVGFLTLLTEPWSINYHTIFFSNNFNIFHNFCKWPLLVVVMPSGSSLLNLKSYPRYTWDLNPRIFLVTYGQWCM